jgi:hypothetical protein
MRALTSVNQMMDPAGIANWFVSYVDWSEGKCHPRSLRAMDVTYEFLKNMTVCLPLFGVILSCDYNESISYCVYAPNPYFFVVHECEQQYHQDEKVHFSLYSHGRTLPRTLRK